MLIVRPRRRCFTPQAFIRNRCLVFLILPSLLFVRASGAQQWIDLDRDPAFAGYRAIERSGVPVPPDAPPQTSRRGAAKTKSAETNVSASVSAGGQAQAAKQPAATNSGSMEAATKTVVDAGQAAPPATIKPAASPAPTPAAADKTATPAAAPPAETKSAPEELPAFAVIDLYSDGLAARHINTYSQLIWDEVFATRRFRLIPRSDALVLLTADGAAETGGAQLRPAEAAEKLHADYLIFGDVQEIGKSWSLTLYLYSTRSARVLASKSLIYQQPAEIARDLRRTTRQMLGPAFAINLDSETETAAPAEPSTAQGAAEDTAERLKDFEMRYQRHLQSLDQRFADIELALAELKRGLAPRNDRGEPLTQPGPTAMGGGGRAVESATSGTELSRPAAPTVAKPAQPSAAEAEEDELQKLIAAEQAAAENRIRAREAVEAGSALNFEAPERLKLFETAKDLQPDNADYLRLYLHALCSQKHYERAALEGRAALERFPHDSFLRMITGFAEFHRGEYAQARTDLEQVLAADPENLNAHYYLGRTLLLIDPPAAREQLQKYIEKARDHPDQEPYVLEARKELEGLND